MRAGCAARRPRPMGRRGRAVTAPPARARLARPPSAPRAPNTHQHVGRSVTRSLVERRKAGTGIQGKRLPRRELPQRGSAAWSMKRDLPEEQPPVAARAAQVLPALERHPRIGRRAGRPEEPIGERSRSRTLKLTGDMAAGTALEFSPHVLLRVSNVHPPSPSSPRLRSSRSATTTRPSRRGSAGFAIGSPHRTGDPTASRWGSQPLRQAHCRHGAGRTTRGLPYRFRAPPLATADDGPRRSVASEDVPLWELPTISSSARGRMRSSSQQRATGPARRWPSD